MNSLKTYRGQVPDRTALFSRSLRNCPNTRKYIKNSQNNKIHKKLILIPEFFQVQLLRMLQRVFRPKFALLKLYLLI